MTSTSAANTNLTSSSTFTRAQPWTWISVGKRTANFTTLQAMIGASGSFNGTLAFTASANTIGVTSDNTSFTTQGSNTDSSFHAAQGVVNVNSSSILASDGVETTGGAAGGTAMSANTSRILRFAPGSSLDGVWMEGGLWPSAFSSGGGGQLGLMNTNMHGTNGYNF